MQTETRVPLACSSSDWHNDTSTDEALQHQHPVFNRASEVPAHLHDAHHDSRRPIFHPQAARGWSSDPCGPIYFKGRYHLFYQHLCHSCQWYWGLCWDHLVSDDLVHWKNLPPAVVPTPGWFDADGCFSGTVELDPELGVPVIMYTGVYLKANQECVQAHGVPPPEHDPGTRFVERQLAAVPADPDDPDLTVWVKLPQPVIYPAPAGLNISCWRDPFCVQRPAAAGGEGDDWVILLASGIRGVGGAVLRFKSKHWTYGWEFDGLLADGDNRALGIKGQDWECPILTKLPSTTVTPAITSLPDLSLPNSDGPDVCKAATVGNSSDSNHSGYYILQEQQQQQLEKQGMSAAQTADSCKSNSSLSSASSVVIEHADAATSAAAAAAAVGAGAGKGACLLEPSGSQQLLLTKSKLHQGSARVGSCGSLVSAAYSQNTSTGSLSGVGHGTAEAAAVAESTAASTGFGSSEYLPDHVSDVDSAAQCSSSLYQREQQRSESNVSLLCSRSEDRISMGDACCTHQLLPERLAAGAAGAGLVITSSSAGSSGSCSTDVSLAAATDAAAAALAAAAGANGTRAPLTEPVLEAVLLSAAVEGETSALTEQHPSTNISVWLEQTADDPTAAAAAAAVAANPPAGSMDDMTVIIKSDDDTRDEQKLLQLQQQATSITTDSSSSSGGGTPFTDVMTAPATFSSSSSSSSKAYQRDWWFCMSPDACNNPITWWLGQYDGKRFDIAAADGPHRLDLGTTLYAASLWIDPQGRQLLYGWMQEHRRVPSPPNNCMDYSYAGCIATPRVLHLVGGNVFQQPLPEIDRLRTKVSWHATDLLLTPDAALMPLQVVSGTHLDINLTLLPPTEAAIAAVVTPPDCQPCSLDKPSPRVGLVFKSWRSEGRGAAVLSFDWSTHFLVFDFDEPFPDAYMPHPEDTPERRRVGGKLNNYEPGTPLSLRILLDGSAVEVFTSTGETLTTRMYRGHPPKCRCQHCSSSSSVDGVFQQSGAAVDVDYAVDDETGVAMYAAGATGLVSRLDVWEMGSCWTSLNAPPEQQQQQQQQQQFAGITPSSAATASAAEAAVGHTNNSAAGSMRSSTALHGNLGSALLLSGSAAAAVPAAGQDVSTAAASSVSELDPVNIQAYFALQEAHNVGDSDSSSREEAAFLPSCDGRGEESASLASAAVTHIAAGAQAVVAQEFLQELNISNSSM